MRERKWVFYLSAPVMLIALFVSIGFSNTESSTVLVWDDILVGIFTSGFITTITSIVGYQTSKKMAIEVFYFECKKILDKIKKIPYYDDDNFEKIIDYYINLSNMDLEKFEFAFGNLSFIFNKRLSKKYHYYIYNRVKELMNEIKIISFHFEFYKKAQNGNN